MADQDGNPILAGIAGRRSIRAFLSRPVPRHRIEMLLAAASRAPSGNNSQPWTVHVLTGATKARLSAAIMEERGTGGPEPAPEYPYYPAAWPEPHLTRRREIGWALYERLGIGKGDRAASRAWHDRNFAFFGAPVGMIITTDRRLGLGALIDLGMFMQALAIGARSLGLETCAQAAFAAYHATARSVLSIPPEQMVVCGMALGFEDRDALPNALHAGRAAVSDFATFHD